MNKRRCAYAPVHRRISGGRSPFGEEIFVSIEGTGCGFVATPDNGDELDIIPELTPEEAREALARAFAGWDTFEWP